MLYVYVVRHEDGPIIACHRSVSGAAPTIIEQQPGDALMPNGSPATAQAIEVSLASAGTVRIGYEGSENAVLIERYAFLA